MLLPKAMSVPPTPPLRICMCMNNMIEAFDAVSVTSPPASLLQSLLFPLQLNEGSVRVEVLTKSITCVNVYFKITTRGV